MIAFQDLLALGAATCWAMTGVLSAEPARHLGAIAFVRWRMTAVAPLLWLIVAWQSTLPSFTWGIWGVMAVSGLVGIFLGDSSLFAAMNRMGPRRTGVLFASHALFSAFLGFALLDERLGTRAYLGALLTVTGVMVAVAWGQRKGETHEWESRPTHWSGVLFALFAAFCQALGALIAKPVLASQPDMDPMLATAIRVTAAIAGLWLWRGWDAWRLQGGGATRVHHPMTLPVFAQALASAVIGMLIGMSLLLWALKGGAVGSVGVLSGLSPVLILPLLWWKLKRAPAPGAWIGAGIAVAGTALVLSRGH